MAVFTFKFQHFDAVEMCHLGPDSVDEEEISEGKIKWHDRSFSGSWIKGRYQQENAIK